MDERLAFKNDLPVKLPIDYHDHLTFTAFEEAGDSEELRDAYTVWKGSMEEYRQAIRQGRELTDPVMFNEVTAQRIMVQRMDPSGYEIMVDQGKELLEEADDLIDRLTVLSGGDSNRMLNLLTLSQVILIRDRIQGPVQKGPYPKCFDEKIGNAVSMRFKDYWHQYVKTRGERVAVDPLDMFPV